MRIVLLAQCNIWTNIQGTIKCQLNVNICQIYVKHKWKANGIMRLIKGIEENRRKGLGVSLGLKVWRLWVWESEGSKTLNIMQYHATSWDITRQTKCLELKNSLVASWRVSPYNHPPLEMGGMESGQNGMVPKVSAWICWGAPGCLV